MNKLFIYYSYSGNGEAVKDYLLTHKIDVRKVITKEPLPKNKFLSILKGGYRAMKGYQDELENFDNNISEYNEIIIGSPIWNSRLSTPINSVLSKLDLTNKKVTFILYSGSGALNKATSKLRETYKDASIINIKEPKKNTEELKKLENI